MGAPRRRVPVIVGPTAVGKTAVACALAAHWELTVISADSRQVYRRLDIGTAKPGPEELARVPHLGLDVVDVGRGYSAGRYARDAAGWFQSVDRSRQPVVVGGTGFYVKALADGLFHEPPMAPESRRALRAWTRERAGGLARWAARLDPQFRGGGRQRAARTVEVALLTGRSLSWWQEHARGQAVMRPWYVRLTLPRATLHERIQRRISAMLEGGWIDEVEALRGEGVPDSAPGLDAVGYREILDFLRGDLARDELVAAIALSTRRYAKRQETWFRNQLAGPIVSLDATVPPEALAREIANRWEEEGD